MGLFFLGKVVMEWFEQRGAYMGEYSNWNASRLKDFSVFSGPVTVAGINFFSFLCIYTLPYTAFFSSEYSLVQKHEKATKIHESSQKAISALFSDFPSKCLYTIPWIAHTSNTQFMKDIEDIRVFQCKIEFYFTEWTPQAVFSSRFWILISWIIQIFPV